MSLFYKVFKFISRLWTIEKVIPTNQDLLQDPAWMKRAFEDVGVKEVPGPKDNPRILEYFRLTGNFWAKKDSVPWCAGYTGAILEESGFSSSKSLAARSYLAWGKKCKPKRGCVVVLWRGRPDSTTGHVGFLVKEDKNNVYLLGGNQSDKVSVAAYPKRRVLGYRWPVTATNSRTNVAGVVGLAGAGSSAILLSARELLSIGSEIKGLIEYVPYAPLIGSCVTILCFLVIVYARYQDFKEKGR